MSRPPARTPALRVVGAVVRANQLRLLRDPVSLAFILAAPFLLILIIGVAVPGDDATRPVGLVAPTDAGIASDLADLLAAEPTLALTRYPDEAALSAAIRRGRMIAGIIIPADLAARVQVEDTVGIRFLSDPVSGPPMSVRTTVQQAVARAGTTSRSVRFVAERSGLPLAAARRAVASVGDGGGLGAVEVASEDVASEDVASETDGDGAPAVLGGFAYTAPRYLVLFVFINAVIASYGLPADRAAGLSRRAFVAPTGATPVLIGEWLYRLLVALAQAAVILLVGAVFFGVAWGDLLAVTAITALFALVATGASVLLGSLARTPEQVIAVGPPLGIGLGMLGGCMWPLEIVGPTMRTIGHATPHAWAVDAFAAVIGAGAGIAAIGTELAVLAAFAVGLLALAAVVHARTMSHGAR